MEHQARIVELRNVLSETIIGQTDLLDKLVIALLAGGHVLVEGLPGLAKTTAIKAVVAAIDASFRRIQLTPDLLPGDLTGTDIYNPQEGNFLFCRGAAFSRNYSRRRNRSSACQSASGLARSNAGAPNYRQWRNA